MLIRFIFLGYLTKGEFGFLEKIIVVRNNIVLGKQYTDLRDIYLFL